MDAIGPTDGTPNGGAAGADPTEVGAEAAEGDGAPWAAAARISSVSGSLEGRAGAADVEPEADR